MNRLSRPLSLLTRHALRSSIVGRSSIRPVTPFLNQLRFGTNDGNSGNDANTERFDIDIECFDPTAKNRAAQNANAEATSNTSKINNEETVKQNESESTDSNQEQELSTEEKILLAEKEQAAAAATAAQVTAQESKDEESSDESRQESQKYDPATLGGMKRSNFRALILGCAFAIAGLVYYTLRATPIVSYCFLFLFSLRKDICFCNETNKETNKINK